MANHWGLVVVKVFFCLFLWVDRLIQLVGAAVNVSDINNFIPNLPATAASSGV